MNNVQIYEHINSSKVNFQKSEEGKYMCGGGAAQLFFLPFLTLRYKIYLIVTVFLRVVYHVYQKL